MAMTTKKTTCEAYEQEYDVGTMGGRIVAYATRDLKEGERLTFNYLSTTMDDCGWSRWRWLDLPGLAFGLFLPEMDVPDMPWRPHVARPWHLQRQHALHHEKPNGQVLGLQAPSWLISHTFRFVSIFRRIFTHLAIVVQRF